MVYGVLNCLLLARQRGTREGYPIVRGHALPKRFKVLDATFDSDPSLQVLHRSRRRGLGGF